MKVLVTGPTGFIGRQVVRRLQAGGDDVTGLVRPGREGALPEGVAARSGDLTDLATLAAAAGDVEAVVHLGAPEGPDLPVVDRAAADALLGGLPPGATLVYTSGAAVPGATGDGLGTEATPKDPSSLFAWRGETEDALFAAAGDRRVVVVRPSVLVHGAGGGGLVGRMLSEAAGSGVVTYVGDGESRVSTVRVEDLADLFVRAVRSATADGVYIAASDDVVRIRDVAEAVAAVAGATPRALALDAAVQERGMVARLLSTTVVVSGHRARTDLGWSPSPVGLLSDLRAPAGWVTAALAGRTAVSTGTSAGRGGVTGGS